MMRFASIVAALLAWCSSAQASGPMMFLDIMGTTTTAFDFDSIPGLCINYDSSTLSTTTNLASWTDSKSGVVAAMDANPDIRASVVTLANGKNSIYFNPAVNGYYTNVYKTFGGTVETFFCCERDAGSVAASFGYGSQMYGPANLANNSVYSRLISTLGTYTSRTNTGLIVMHSRVENVTNQVLRYANYAEETNTTTAGPSYMSKIGFIGSGTYHDGYWHQLLIYTNTLTPENRNTIIQKLYEKWGN